MTKFKMTWVDGAEAYEGDGLVMKREYETLTENGNKMAGRWVLRTVDNKTIDYDKYRNDLASAWDIQLVDG